MSIKPTVTLGILTLNEELHIAQCIQSASFVDRVVVIDSGSTDRTVTIAQSLGAEVFVYPDWQGFSVQRNRLLDQIHTDYILFLDADEVMTPELSIEVQQAVQENHIELGTTFFRQVAFGKELKYFVNKGGVPRLFKRNSLIRCEGIIIEQFVMKNPNPIQRAFKYGLLHYSWESIVKSILKMTQYVQHSASKKLQEGKRGSISRGIGSGLITFFKFYFLRRGFLCGAEGFLFCFFIALEHFFRYAALTYDAKNIHESCIKR